MKLSSLAAALISLTLFAGCSTPGQPNNPAIKNPYVGLNLPGVTPQQFAPGLVTTDGYEYGGTFTPDLTEFYYIRSIPDSKKQEIAVLTNQDGTWTETAAFPRKGTHVFSPDGGVMHLGKRYLERTDDGWSELQKLPEPLASLPIMRLSSSESGTVYFDEFKRDFTGAIRYSKQVDGQYQTPQLIGATINSGKSFHPFIAPDESYIIFDSKRDDGYGDSDLYISYRQDDGSWGQAINLGDKINTDAWEAAASVTSDGKYMFFNRNMGSKNYENVDIFWVSAGFIDELRDQ